MRWGCEYKQFGTDVVGLVIFTAGDLVSATKYVDAMATRCHFDSVANLKPLAHGAAITELQRLFPGFLQVRLPEKDKGHA